MNILVCILSIILTWQASASAQTKKPMSVAELAAYNKPDREKILYEGAKKEGTLTWYTSLTGGPNTDMPECFCRNTPASRSRSIAAIAMR